MPFLHGMSRTPIHKKWLGMLRRCYNKNDPSYAAYGGRNITVCEEWRTSFVVFFRDMGNPPTTQHSLERINNEKGYSADNCKWATAKEQARNRRTSRLISFDGKTQTLAAWGEFLRVDSRVLFLRLKKGWSIEKTLTIPLRRRRPHIECDEDIDYAREDYETRHRHDTPEDERLDDPRTGQTRGINRDNRGRG